MTPTLTDPATTVTPDAAVRKPRSVERLVTGQATSDGDGVKLTRVLTQPLQRRLDPFLMLDAFGSDGAGDYIGGFPDHPHRGFETVTYMIAGRMCHRDSAGNQGLLQNGGVQWMTAGSGLIHSELPGQEEGRMEGFQLWLNLPAVDKMTAPGYRDISTGKIPELRLPGTTFDQALIDARSAMKNGAPRGAILIASANAQDVVEEVPEDDRTKFSTPVGIVASGTLTVMDVKMLPT